MEIIMERLIKIGKIVPKKASEIKNSRIGIGFEKLDRKIFDPEKAYDKLADIGAKWVRIQSGWERTEQTKGVYDFSWLDSIVDNLHSRGLIPWINLVYGNGLYDEDAALVYGGVGCPPIKSETAKKGWAGGAAGVLGTELLGLASSCFFCGQPGKCSSIEVFDGL